MFPPKQSDYPFQLGIWDIVGEKSSKRLLSCKLESDHSELDAE